MMIKSGSLLTRNINKFRQLISIQVTDTILAKEHLLDNRTYVTYWTGAQNNGSTGEGRVGKHSNSPSSNHLYHSRMIPNIVSRPRGSILHSPTFLRNLLCHGNQPIYPDFELFIVSLKF